jgi:hypothetical protein
MIERREYIDRIKAAVDVWSDELRRLEQHVIEGDPGMADVWQEQRQELQRLLLAVQDNITCLRRRQAAAGSDGDLAWQQVCCDLKGLTERLYAGN